MYDFIDVTETSDGVMLPAEAMKINGEYIENMIPGYRTISVSGRESLSPKISTYETGVMDGSKIKSRKYPSRTITVRYQLIAESNESFRSAYNMLGGILNTENAQLIFDDEPDKFFIGTPSTIGDVAPGLNSVTGEFEILCVDPFKYSVYEYEAVPEFGENSVLIDYGGTHKSYPKLEADFYSEDDGNGAALTGKGDCGYVAFFTENEKIIQLGDPDEVDGEEFPKSQTLLNQIFQSNTAWGSTAQSLWSANNGTILGYDVVQSGAAGMGGASFTAAGKPQNAVILNTQSKASAPYVNYKISSMESYRGADYVVLSVTVMTSLANTSSYFGNGYTLKGSLYIGGAWRDIQIKSAAEYWSGTSGHAICLSIKVTGISATTASITGIKFKVTRPDGLGTTGVLSETSCANIPISQYMGTPTSYYLTAADFGTFSGNKWHGPSITRTIGADANGETGAINFTFSYKQKMAIGNGSSDQNQLGGFHCNLTAADGSVVAGIRIVKNKTGKTALLMMHVNGVKVHQVNLDLSYNNKYFGNASNSVMTSTIQKSGSEVILILADIEKYLRTQRLRQRRLLKSHSCLKSG